MLIKPTREEGESYIDFAYELALDPSRSGYPTYADGIKTKEDFADTCISGLTREDRQVLLYLEDGAVSGWILTSIWPFPLPRTCTVTVRRPSRLKYLKPAVAPERILAIYWSPRPSRSAPDWVK